MVKSRRVKKTTTKKPAGMPTLPLPPLPTSRPAPLEPSTAQNTNVQGCNGHQVAYDGYVEPIGEYGVPAHSASALHRPHNGHLHGHEHAHGSAHVHGHRAAPSGQHYPHHVNGSTSASAPVEAHEPELLPPPTSIDPRDPRFRAAWQEWTTSALGRLDQLPKLSQNQLAAIARAAAAGVGAGTAGALTAPANGNGVAESSEMAALQALQAEANGDGSGNGQQVLGIDLPASLAALFEAKLTLDREKAKLVRMQKELQGYRAAAGRMKEEEDYCHCECHECHHDHDDHDHEHDHVSGEDEYSYECDYDYPCDHGCAHGEHNHPPEDLDDEDGEEYEYADDGDGFEFDDSDPRYAQQPQLAPGSAMMVQHPHQHSLQMQLPDDARPGGEGAMELMYDGQSLYTQQAWDERQRQYYASLPPITDDPERMASLSLTRTSDIADEQDATVAQLFDWIKAVVSMHR